MKYSINQLVNLAEELPRPNTGDTNYQQWLLIQLTASMAWCLGGLHDHVDTNHSEFKAELAAIRTDVGFIKANTGD